MRYLSSTYLRDVNKYIYSFFYKKDENYCITVKKIIDIKFPFILNEDLKDIKIIDNNYYILEYFSLDDNYICRVHLDDQKNVIERFFIATKNNRLENGIPVYEDLKLSYVSVGKVNKVYNLDVLETLLRENKISREDYNQAINTIKKIEREIYLNKNYVYNLDYRGYLK